jgi:FMN phosphatase YigB (HAD superfamily)
MSLKAVTFDFWSTLVDGQITPERTSARLARLHAAIVGAGHAHEFDHLQRAYERALARVADDARESLIDVGPPGRWLILAEELGIPPGRVTFEIFEQTYTDLTLDPLPDAMPHVHVAVDAVRRAGYRMAVICNTGMAGGAVLRQVLERHGLLDKFELTVFSNEYGLAKPHPGIFQHTLGELGGIAPQDALHVGDLEELDVEGARRAHLHSARYVPGTDGQIQTDADIVVTDWRHFADQLAAYDSGLEANGRGLPSAD